MKKHIKPLCLLLSVLAIVFALPSCREIDGELTDTLEVSGLSVEVYVQDERTVGLVVFDGERKKVSFNCNGAALAAVDLNFDGYDDIRLSSVDNDGCYECFIYQPSIKSFSRNATLDTMLEPVWDYDSKTISSRVLKIEYYSEKEGEISGYRETRGSAEWCFEGGVLKQTYEEGIYHDSDGELYCVYKATVVDGELYYDYAAEKWYYADELADAGYVW